MATPLISPMARAEDVRRLQVQMDQMKERLDFISSMLPIVNFSQDYFQKVECEASVQLLRLQNAQVARKLSDDEEDVNSAQLETVKWLHFMTEIVMAIVHATGDAATADSPVAGPSCGGSGVGSGWGNASEAPFSSLGIDVGNSSHGSPSTKSAEPSSPALSGAVVHKPPVSRQYFDVTPPPPSVKPKSNVTERTVAPRAGATAGNFLLQTASRSSPAPQAVRPNYSMPHSSQVDDGSSSWPVIEPGTGGTAGAAGLGERVLGDGPGGLVLGKGSWATAYNRSHGPRREALRLLCITGIVTARELADDNTVISQEHIDDCVTIAIEMLHTHSMDLWAQQVEEANQFFESRFTTLYTKRVSERTGSA
eukprot:TRINITY_DN74022_c0_g1_i1.p1 TRINITY_DN74022_c0_g1~~TRINITY_DN74022_c0_g1_i1.p1  ORF type:complete len:366 (+),score=41.30 TRINITY_DN74022_c0_g1_i1:137-1234(+)